MSHTWESITNPCIADEAWSIKDASLAYHEGRWHCVASAFDEARSSIVAFEAPSLDAWSPMRWRWDGVRDGWIGLCSPSVMRDGDGWVLTLNSWGDAAIQHNRFFYTRSRDLRAWGPLRPLAHDLTAGMCVIDSALARHGDRWYLACSLYPGKGTRMATAGALDGPWSWLGDGQPSLHTPAGRENGLYHENFQFLAVDGVWHLLCTDHPAPQTWLYRMIGDPDDPRAWLRWGEGRRLAVPAEAWNTHHRDNAAALWDHRAVDGYWYLIYAGQGHARADEFRGAAGRTPKPRGWNRLGVARSRDLIYWEAPGASMEATDLLTIARGA